MIMNKGSIYNIGAQANRKITAANNMLQRQIVKSKNKLKSNEKLFKSLDKRLKKGKL